MTPKPSVRYVVMDSGERVRYGAYLPHIQVLLRAGREIYPFLGGKVYFSANPPTLIGGL